MNDWKIIESEDDLPRWPGEYVVIDKRDPIPAIDCFVATSESDRAEWLKNKTAYLPDRIPDYDDLSD